MLINRMFESTHCSTFSRTGRVQCLNQTLSDYEVYCDGFTYITSRGKNGV